MFSCLLLSGALFPFANTVTAVHSKTAAHTTPEVVNFLYFIIASILSCMGFFPNLLEKNCHLYWFSA